MACSANRFDPLPADAAFAEMNLRMLVLTGGRERTLGEYQDLAGTAGLRVAAVHRAADGPRDHRVPRVLGLSPASVCWCGSLHDFRLTNQYQ
jgi:hypothetical protein